ncbi:3-phosphoshikimate 1-carboxyvinyltransferase [Sphingosinicella sp. CPCC 101087]|uniref:3-phosphoshikimate 1-carboxyvinyltransferase n=1 Tax=Sphingosinicella sp. CPCC 101087 TaxID=2497754 RepID=UPI001FB1823D|nr:3-phosphoshikimate 1-carboxyvinyltransferase [Sphingosinicella sp. CPCC 101087]
MSEAPALTAEAGDRLSAGRAEALRGSVRVPGDKSISHRALILAAMAEGESRITGLLEGQDVLDTAAAVGALGAAVERREGAWHVAGAPWRSPDKVIDCGNSGTGVRLLMGAVAGRPVEATFTGDDSLRGRPMGRVIEPLRAMGGRIEAAPGDRLPLTVHGGTLHGIRHLNDKASAQVKSAILLAGLSADGLVEVIEPRASRDHSEIMLKAFGCEIETAPAGEGRVVRLGRRRFLRGTDVDVPGDPSSAAFPLVAALIVPGSEVTVRDMLLNPLRTGLLTTLSEMGAAISIANRREVGGETVGDVTARASGLRGIEVGPARAPSMIDEYPILAVAAACADGVTRLHGLGELRVKESDRLEAILAGLRAGGVEAESHGDTLEIQGSGSGSAPPGGGQVSTHGDHRIAMSFLVLGMAARAPVAVDRPEMIATSFPLFAELMQSLGARIEAA